MWFPANVVPRNILPETERTGRPCWADGVPCGAVPPHRRRCANVSTVTEPTTPTDATLQFDRTEIDALLFDLGGVVVEIDFALCLGHWADASGRTIDELAIDLLADPAYQDHERGLLSTDDYFEHLRTALSIDLDDTTLLEGWNAIFGDSITSTVATAEAARAAGIAVHAFSNTNAAHHAAWGPKYAGELVHFDEIFLSHEIGHRKPDAVAFEHVADAIGVPLGRILFFDDTFENIEGAQAIGMPAVHVTGPDSVTAAVASLF